MKNFPIVVPLAVVTLSLSVTAAFGQASFDLLGPYTSGSTRYVVRDVSADGRILLGDVYQVGPFTWRAGDGFTYLPTPEPGDFPAAVPGSDPLVTPLEISPDARSMVGLATLADERHQGFHWNPSTGYRALPGVAGTPGESRSFAATSNASGTLVGGWMFEGSFRAPIVWDLTTSTAAIRVPLLPGHTVGEIKDIADSASVAVGTSFQSPNSHPRAFRWTAADGTTELPAPAGMRDAFADCVSADGNVIFGSATVTRTGKRMLVRWNAQGLSERIGTIPANHSELRVVDCSADGTAAVGISSSFIYDETSFYWSEATGFADFRSLLESRGAVVDSAPTHFMLVRGISADGNVVVGTLQHYGGNTVTTGFTSRLAPEPPTQIGVDLCDPAVPNSIGAAPRLEAVGSSVLAHNDVVLRVRDLPGRSLGFLLASQTQGFLPGFGGGVGTQCLGQTYGLLYSSAVAQPAGIFQRKLIRIDLPTLQLSSGAVVIQPGDTWHLQFWYRDSGAGGPTTNLTSARSITFQ